MIVPAKSWLKNLPDNYEITFQDLTGSRQVLFVR